MKGSRNLDILAEEMIWADYDEEQPRGVNRAYEILRSSTNIILGFT